MTEAHLIEQCRNNQREAQKKIFERYQGRMFRLTFRYLREKHQAEDALMKGFYKVFTQMKAFEDRGPGSFEKWITRIMVNEALMLLRGPKIIWTSDENVSVPDGGELPGQALDAEVLYAYIRQLPDGYRTIFNLYAIEGFTHEEIAVQLGISEGTSKSQLSKARGLLQKWIKNEMQSDYGKAEARKSTR